MCAKSRGGDHVTVVTVHGHVSSKPKRHVVLVPFWRNTAWYPSSSCRQKNPYRLGISSDYSTHWNCQWLSRAQRQTCYITCYIKSSALVKYQGEGVIEYSYTACYICIGRCDIALSNSRSSCDPWKQWKVLILLYLLVWSYWTLELGWYDMTLIYNILNERLYGSKRCKNFWN